MWKERFGEGTFELLHQRNGDEAPYPVVLTIEDDVPYWHVTNADTAIAGVGKCELRYIVDHVVIKSCTFITDVIESLGEGTEAPEPQKAWVDQVLEAADKVENAVTYPPIIGENGNWLVYDFEANEYVDSGVSASGDSSLTPEQLELINSVPDKADKDSIPTKVSELHNDEGFVKTTDIAERNKLGIVSCGWGFGVGVNKAGTLYTERATNEMINEKVNDYAVICPSNLEYAVKSIGDNIYASASVIGDIDSALSNILQIQYNYMSGTMSLRNGGDE